MQLKERKLKETRNSKNIYQNKLAKAGFHCDVTNEVFKELPRRTIADKILHDKACNVAKNLKYDGYQRRLIKTTEQELILALFLRTQN